MKKYILLLCCAFLGYSSIYASFPVSQKTLTESVEISESPKTIPLWDDTPLANWSLVLGLLWLPCLLTAFIFAWDGPEENALFFLIAGVGSFIGAIITAFRSLSKENGGRWKAYAGLALTLGVLLLSLLEGDIELFLF